MNTAGQIGGIISGFLDPIIHSPIVETSVRLAAWGLVILWIATVLWAFRDAMARTHNPLAVLGAPMAILAATPLGFPLAVLVWRILRPQHTKAEEREQRLTIDALRASSRPHTCPTCQATVNVAWRRCPWCRTWLMAPCPRCERLAELSAVVCPWCTLELGPGSLAPREGAPGMVPVMATSGAMIPIMDPALLEPARATPVAAATAAPRQSRAAATPDATAQVQVPWQTPPADLARSEPPAPHLLVNSAPHGAESPAPAEAQTAAPPPAPQPVVDPAPRRGWHHEHGSSGAGPSRRGQETSRTRDEPSPAPSTALW